MVWEINIILFHGNIEEKLNKMGNEGFYRKLVRARKLLTSTGRIVLGKVS